ncbi:hypothetical protein BHM03_00003011 [Ensete ventricosum]|nr:hypothetical protein BHM03_00003011 [Ensete ventricosum]
MCTATWPASATSTGAHGCRHPLYEQTLIYPWAPPPRVPLVVACLRGCACKPSPLQGSSPRAATPIGGLPTGGSCHRKFACKHCKNM